MTHDPSRIANRDRLRSSCPPELPSIRAEWQCALTSSAGIQTLPVESPLRRSVPGSALTLPGPPGPGSMGRSTRTALEPSSLLGWAEIRHPFHPLRGQRFEVLKKWRVAGVDTLFLRELERGRFSVARGWTGPIQSCLCHSVCRHSGWTPGRFLSWSVYSKCSLSPNK